MSEKYFSKNKNGDFYLPGQEIKIGKSISFCSNEAAKDPLTSCKNRLCFAIFCFCAVYMVICLRLFDVCLNGNYISRSREYVAASTTGSPIKRADIVDRNGTILATSLPTVNLYANPKKVFAPKKAARELHKILPELSEESLYDKLTHKGKFVYLKRNLTPSQQYQINALGIPGLDFENGEKRVYPHQNLFAQVLGSTDIDNNGVSGIERELNERLVQSDIPLQLTVDAGIQDTIREFLIEGCKKYSALGATAILMDVQTSEIIAMVSVPDYDPNNIKVESERALFNMATKGVYEPGSVLKVFNTAMSLESGKVKVNEKFDATQPWKLKYNVIKDYRGENRWLSVPEILVYSSNIGSARMALKAGGTEQRNFLEKIGFFHELNVEVAERGTPLVPKRWGDGTIATVAFGYGIAVSPLHVITGFSAVVNGGIYHNPTLVKTDKKEEGHRVISYNTSKAMRKLLRLVVTDGSGKRANIAGYEIAGKTGTANKLSDNGKYVDKKVRTTFVSTFPASDPKYAFLMMMDEPKATKETWGFVTAGWNTVPTAGKILTAIAPQLNLKANYDLDELRRARIIEASYSK